MPKTRKIIVIVSLCLLVVQLPWFFIVQAIVNKTEVKTTATVISIASADADCTGDQPGYPDPTCDHSLRQYPVYAYYDTSGKRHVQDDMFFGEYKQGNPLSKLFLKKVGDSVTAYYTKDMPDQVLFMASPWAYAAWLIPLYLAVTGFIIVGVLFVIQKVRK